ncbi:putative lipid II flippase FtsW [Acidobacteriia bacterium AH_259_A11_L15]|nr:putative lipid II flippase FtsW [Acidobacteriia bacterium AH_259_A11_L15]
MAKRYQHDRWLLGVTMALLVLGVVMVFSASAVYADEVFGRPLMFLARQVLWLTLGVTGLFLMMRLDYRRLGQPDLVFTAVFVVLVLLVAVLFLDPVRNSHRWIRWGPMSVQPSELAKLVLILFLAYFLERRRHAVNDVPGTLIPAAAISTVFVALVVIEPDLGTAVVLGLIAGAMFFAAGMRIRYLLYLGLAALPVAYFLIVRVPYRLARVRAFLDPGSDPQGSGFQMIQSLLAVGSGGVTGVGLMEGRQKLFYLPEAHTDFIFAVVGEELGLIGAATVVILFGVFLLRGLKIATTAPDGLARLLTVGVTTMVVGQALINLSVVLGLLPTKGIPLPFISYGGSDLLVMLLGVGLLLNVSQYTD